MKVNGSLVSLGDRCSPKAKIELIGSAKQAELSKKTVLLHKPLGVVSSQPEPGYFPAVKLLTEENFYSGKRRDIPTDLAAADLHKVAVCGRLDINSTGLLVFTQRGSLARQLLSRTLEKEYLVTVDRRCQYADVDNLRQGVMSENQLLTVKSAEIIGDRRLRMTLLEGRKHHIRRMCLAFGLRVVEIERVRIGNISLGDLPLGQWRYLLPHEKFADDDDDDTPTLSSRERTFTS